jgi:two-component system, OmpR family, response regulator CpxR
MNGPDATRVSSSARFLVIDDDVESCALIRQYFSFRNLAVDAEHDGVGGLARALAGCYSLVFLDVMLPGLDGFEVLRQLRGRCRTPVIMLTSRAAVEDRIAGLDGGADDYLPKPFGLSELLARARAILRRSAYTELDQLEPFEVNGVNVDPATRKVTRRGKAIRVTAIEFDILERLARSAGRVVSRDDLVGWVYRREATPFDRSVDVHVHHLRRKLGSRMLIKTVRGEGYLFCPD